MIWYGCRTWDMSCEQIMKRAQVCWNIAVRKIGDVPYTVHHTSLFPHKTPIGILLPF